MDKYINSAADAVTGRAIPGATVSVYLAGTGIMATLYSSMAMASLGNPVTADEHGTFWFYAKNGVYDITISKTGFASQTWSGVQIEGDFNARDFGALGDGVTDDLAALQLACDTVYAAGGGKLILDPTGAPYLISDSLVVSNGVQIEGQISHNFNGATATNAQWAAHGTWIKPTHATHSAIILSGHGSSINGVNFIHDQPIPSGGSWTANQYGYCIEVIASHTCVSNIDIVNASHGVYFHYTTESGGGTDVRIQNVIISAFNVRMRTSCVNDVMFIENVHCRNLWYSSDSRVAAYIRSNTYGWYCGYTDNPMVDGLEFFEDYRAMYFVDETCLSVTHSMYNGTLNNVQFNLPQVCMLVAASTTTVRANFGTVIAQTGNAFGYTWSDTAFQLGSNNVEVFFESLKVSDAGGKLFVIGGGSGGKVAIRGLQVDTYSSIAAGQECFSINSGASLNLGPYRIVKNGSAGVRFSGAGYENILTPAYASVQYFTNQNEVSITGNGAYQAMSTQSYLRPGQMGVHQGRIIGELNVTTSSAGTTASVRAGGLNELIATGINTASNGSKSFDSGWVDITEANLTGLSVIGEIQVLATNPVVLNNGNIQILYR